MNQNKIQKEMFDRMDGEGMGLLSDGYSLFYKMCYRDRLWGWSYIINVFNTT